MARVISRGHQWNSGCNCAGRRSSACADWRVPSSKNKLAEEPQRKIKEKADENSQIINFTLYLHFLPQRSQSGCGVDDFHGLLGLGDHALLIILLVTDEGSRAVVLAPREHSLQIRGARLVRAAG